MPRAPKPPGQRVRRNKDQKQWRGLPAGGRQGKPPALPPKRPGWLKATRAWWATIWASPMAIAWLPADVPALVRLARLIEYDLRGDGEKETWSEIRQLEDRFGLSPKARRLLMWEVSNTPGQTPDEPAPEPDREPLADVRRLRAVDAKAS